MLVASWHQRNSHFIACTGLNSDINRIPTVSTISISKPLCIHTSVGPKALLNRCTGHRQAGRKRGRSPAMQPLWFCLRSTRSLGPDSAEAPRLLDVCSSNCTSQKRTPKYHRRQRRGNAQPTCKQKSSAKSPVYLYSLCIWTFYFIM